MSCGTLDGPDNGAINCTGSVYEDTCSFTCDDGYELTGSDTRTCQSDRSWSGDETVCTPGIFVVLIQHDSNHTVPLYCTSILI